MFCTFCQIQWAVVGEDVHVTSRVLLGSYQLFAVTFDQQVVFSLPETDVPPDWPKFPRHRRPNGSATCGWRPGDRPCYGFPAS